MKGYYVIEITERGGKRPYYVNFAKRMQGKPTLVLGRANAQRFDNRYVAQIVSDFVWENYWNRMGILPDLRSVVYIEAMPRKAES